MLKRIIVLIMMAISLFSYSANAAVPSLLPYDSSWTVSQLRGFINAGADVNARDEGGRTPLMVAAFNANPEVIKTLITAGADVNATGKYGWTPLMVAGRYSENPEVFRTLIAAGADVNARNDFGSTPLMEAAGYRFDPPILDIMLR